ncbi:MAG: hypothetical protein WCK65_02120 [Rhodospirillaceae bacterium]
MLAGLVLVAGLVVSSCASRGRTSESAGPTPSAPQVQAAEFQQIIAELRRASTCISDAEAAPGFAPLRAKAPSDTHDSPYPTYMLDKKKATPAEGQLITKFLETIAPCQPDFGAPTVRSHQSITRMISDTWTQQQELYRHLKEGLISWGVFNQGTRSNADKLSGGLQALKLTNE